MLHKSTSELSSKPIIGRYRLLNFLHRGKNKSVYQAIDTHTAKSVTLKLLRLDQESGGKQQRLQHFNNIMEAVAALDHPYIFPVLDFGKMTSEQEQKYEYVYIAMPLAAERSLDIWLSKQNNLSTPPELEDIGQFLSRAAEALQYAHDKNVLHLGIKQTNFLIRYQQVEKHFPALDLSDFSIAHIIDLSQHLQHLLNNTEMSYAIAPELLDEQPVAASDQYALAALVYELLTSTIYIPEWQRELNPPMLPSPDENNSRLTPAVNEVLQHALSREPNTRYPSVAAFAEAFEHALYKGKHGESTHIMLGISQAEALTGVSYPLAITDKQRVTITIPPNAQAGQVLQIAKAGQASRYGGPRGTLIVTLAIRPNPNDNQQIIEQLRHVSDNLQTLQLQPVEIQQQLQAVDRKVTHILNTSDEEEVRVRGLEDIVPYVSRQVSPGLAMVFIVLAVIVIFGNCILSSTLKGAIIANGNSNIQAITLSNAQILATANARTRAVATAATLAQATTTVRQAAEVQNATNAQQIPQQYHITKTDNANLIFNDLIAGSNNGQWSNQDPKNNQSCYFDKLGDTRYHAQMLSIQSTPYFCQPSNTTGNTTNTTAFVIQVQMEIINGDVGGIAFNLANKSYGYFYINQSGQYEIGVNNTPFSLGKGQNDAIRKSIGPNISNLLAVVANGPTLTFYANLQPIFSIRGVQLEGKGTVALVARCDGSPTNIAYQKIKIWQY